MTTVGAILSFLKGSSIRKEVWRGDSKQSTTQSDG